MMTATRIRLRFFLPLAAVFTFALFTGESFAIPSFARKYRASCSTCHNPFPQLNSFGRLFRAKGYRMPGRDERFVRDPQVPLGDPIEGRLWPRSIASSDLPGSSVAAFLTGSNLNVVPDREDGANVEFDGIDEISLILGGTVGPRWSFFGDIDLFEEGEPGEIGRLFLQYNRSLHFNLRGGLFEPRAVPLSNHRRLIRTTAYLADVLPILAAQNFFGFSPSQKGVEGYGRVAGPGGKGEFEWAVGIVNGEPGGAFEAFEEVAATEVLIGNLEEAYGQRGTFDFNDQKDVYANLDYEVWLRGAYTFGAYYYRGTSGFLLDPADPDTFLEHGNAFQRWGARFRWEQERGFVNVVGAASFGNDELDRPTLNDLDTRIYTAEIQWLPWPWLIPALRAEQVDLDSAIPMVADQFERYTLEITFLPAANIKIAVGGSRSSSDAPDLPPFEEVYRTSLIFAF